MWEIFVIAEFDKKEEKYQMPLALLYFIQSITWGFFCLKCMLFHFLLYYQEPAN